LVHPVGSYFLTAHSIIYSGGNPRVQVLPMDDQAEAELQAALKKEGLI
jgi:hypothetical protein